MTKLLVGAELVEVNVENGKATLMFLDSEQGEIREVTFNQNVYDKDSKKFVPSEEKAQQVEEWTQQYFGLKFADITQAVGTNHDVYCYDKFNSLWEVKIIKKFESGMEGQILTVDVSEVVDDGQGIKIRFEYDGDTYESKMQYATFLESKNEWFVNPQKREKQYEKFEDKFGFAIFEKEQLVGKTIMVEVKKAMGKFIYVEVKPFPKKKKK